jgi:hypothetical protein
MIKHNKFFVAMAFLILKSPIAKIYAVVRVILFGKFGKFEEAGVFKFYRKKLF